MPCPSPARSRLGAVVALGLASALGLGSAARGAEPPPAQGTRLVFQKRLTIQTTARGRVFLEMHRTVQGDTLAGILASDYGVQAADLPALAEVFREANPGVDPDRLPPGRLVRVPFKIEESPGAPVPVPAPRPSPAAEKAYVVRAGESLWRILKNRFRVSREAMPRALKAVARANPGVKNLDHVVVGQRLVIPGGVAGESVSTPDAGPAPPLPWVRPFTALLEQLGCRVTTSGETFLPLSRGRTVRLDGREFPLIVGPSGRHVLLDPSSRLSVALTRSLGEAWGYSVLQGAEPDAEAFFAKVLPRLGFHQVEGGSRAIDAVPGGRFVARPLWTVVARPEDPWEGRIHLLFPGGARLDPDLTALALEAGFSVHLLGSGSAPAPNAGGEAPGEAAELVVAEPGRVEGSLLDALGVPHRVRPDIECDLGGGVRYHLRPELTFDFEGTAYAVPPPEPRRADALLERAGYFAVPLPDADAPFDRLLDLLALLRIRGERTLVEVPADDSALVLSAEGVVFDAPAAAQRLYPSWKGAPGPSKVFITEALVPPQAARALLGRGYAPWVLRRTRESRTP